MVIFILWIEVYVTKTRSGMNNIEDIPIFFLGRNKWYGKIIYDRKLQLFFPRNNELGIFSLFINHDKP